MIRPVAFRMNEETAVNNYFQKEINLSQDEITKNAQTEFDELVNKLRDAGVQVKVFDDILENNTPDSIFPNNWISFHEGGKVVLYPMFAENRRKERRQDVIQNGGGTDFIILLIIDLVEFDDGNSILEGTGSLVLDRANRKAYCAISDRAEEKLVHKFCDELNYTPILFVANQTVNNERKAIYHTNVMMALGETFAVICLDTIDDENQKQQVIESLTENNKEIIEITEEQMHSFAGNMLQVKGSDGKRILVMSQQAHESLTEVQIRKLEEHSTILNSDLKTIETLGGGSARCMMAEVFN